MFAFSSNLQALNEVLGDYLSRRETETGQSLHVTDGILDRWLELRRQLEEANSLTGEHSIHWS